MYMLESFRISTLFWEFFGSIYLLVNPVGNYRVIRFLHLLSHLLSHRISISSRLVSSRRILDEFVISFCPGHDDRPVVISPRLTTMHNNTFFGSIKDIINLHLLVSVMLRYRPPSTILRHAQTATSVCSSHHLPPTH